MSIRHARRRLPYLVAVPLAAALLCAAGAPASADVEPAPQAGASATPGPETPATETAASETSAPDGEDAPPPPAEEPAPDAQGPADADSPDGEAPDGESTGEDTDASAEDPDASAEAPSGEPGPSAEVPASGPDAPVLTSAPADPGAEELMATSGEPADGTAGGAVEATVLRLQLDVDTPTRSYLRYSYRKGCPVGPSGLRALHMNFWGFDGRLHRGTLVVRKSEIDEVKAVFAAMLEKKFPIRRMTPVEAYKGSDIRSMAADNTSAFNCRHVTGDPTRLSQHSYGNAIDINTVENPYVTRSRVYPTAGRPYLKRSNVRKGMITPHGVVRTAFSREQYPWGGRWAHPDYQHFSSNGR